MTEKDQYLAEAKENWHRISKTRKPGQEIIDEAACERLLGAFQLGGFFYNIFNLSESRIEYTSKGFSSLLGIAPEEITTELFFDHIHPEDIPWVIESERRSAIL